MALKRNYTMYTGELRRPTKAYRNPGDTYDLLFELAKMKHRRTEPIVGNTAIQKSRSTPSPVPVRKNSPQQKTIYRRPKSAANEASRPTDEQDVAGGSGHDHSHSDADTTLLRNTEQTVSADQNADSVPDARSRGTISFHENNLYVFGGCCPTNVYTGSRFRNDVLCYSITQEQWTRVPCRGNFPKPRVHHSAIVKDSKLVIYGGVDEEGQLFNDMYALSLREPHHWKKVSIRMPSAQSSCIITQPPAGGLPSPLSSQTSAPSPPHLCSHAATLHHGRNSMLIHGGRTHDAGPSPALYEFRFQSQQWARVGNNTFVPSTSSNTVGPLLYNHSATVYNNLLYVFGGSTYHHGDYNRPNDLTFTYDFDEMLWRTIETRGYPQLDALCYVFFAKLVSASSSSTPTLFTVGNRQTASVVLRPSNATSSQWRLVSSTQSKEYPDEKDNGFPDVRIHAAATSSGSSVFLYGGEKRRLPAETKSAGSADESLYSDLWVYDLLHDEWVYIPPSPPMGGKSQHPSVTSSYGAGERVMMGEENVIEPQDARDSPGITSEGDELNRSVSRTRARLDPTRRVTYKMSSTFNKDYEMQDEHRVPLWKRSNLPQPPPEEPNFKLYYGFTDPNHHNKKRPHPPPDDNDTEPEKDKPNEQLNMLKQILEMQKEHPHLKQKKQVAGFVPITVDAVADKFAVTSPETLKSLIEHTPPQSILHSLLNEKYKFDKEKQALIDKAKVPPDEIARYESLMDRVINSYITKTHSLLVTDRVPILPHVREPSMSEAESMVRKELISRLEASFSMDKGHEAESIPLLPPEPDLKLSLPSLHPMVSIPERRSNNDDEDEEEYKQKVLKAPKRSSIQSEESRKANLQKSESEQRNTEGSQKPSHKQDSDRQSIPGIHQKGDKEKQHTPDATRRSLDESLAESNTDAELNHTPHEVRPSSRGDVVRPTSKPETQSPTKKVLEPRRSSKSEPSTPSTTEKAKVDAQRLPPHEEQPIYGPKGSGSVERSGESADEDPKATPRDSENGQQRRVSQDSRTKEV